MTSAERHLCSCCFPLVAAWQFATGTGSDWHPTLASNQLDRVSGVRHGTKFGDAR
jgi:hypothetical protein